MPKSVTKIVQYVGFALVCGLIGALTVFGLMRGISEVFANILVAAGTFVLAFFTWQSVSETKEILSSEDRRFRQSRMPLMKLYAPPYLQLLGDRNIVQIDVQNVGGRSSPERSRVRKGYCNTGMAAPRDVH